MENNNPNNFCPKCAAENKKDATECRQCGLVFEKYSKARAKLLYEAVKAFHDELFGEAEQLFENIKANYPELTVNAERHLAIIHEHFQHKYMAKALEAYEHNRFDKAAELFKEAKANYPELGKKADEYLEIIKKRKQDIRRKKESVLLINNFKMISAGVGAAGLLTLLYYWFFYSVVNVEANFLSVLNNRIAGAIVGATFTFTGCLSFVICLSAKVIIQIMTSMEEK